MYGRATAIGVGLMSKECGWNVPNPQIWADLPEIWFVSCLEVNKQESIVAGRIWHFWLCQTVVRQPFGAETACINKKCLDLSEKLIESSWGHIGLPNQFSGLWAS